MKKTSHIGIVDIVSSITLSALLIPTFVSAATSATVTATVTVQNVAVSVSDGTVAYGTLGTSSSANTASGDLDDSQTATNDGNVATDFNIRGQNSANWTLAASVGADQYKHDFCVTDCDGTPTWTALTTSNQSLASSVASSGTQVFDLRINTPSSSTNYTSQSVDVIVQASAS